MAMEPQSGQVIPGPRNYGPAYAMAGCLAGAGATFLACRAGGVRTSIAVLIGLAVGGGAFTLYINRKKIWPSGIPTT